MALLAKNIYILYEYICSIIQLCSANIDNLYSYLNPTNAANVVCMCNEITNVQLYAWVTADIYCLCFFVCMYVCLSNLHQSTRRWSS